MMLVAASGPSWGANERAVKAQQTVNEYVDLWIALSPVSYMNHQQSWLLGTLSRLHLADVVNSLFPYGFLADPFWDSGISDLEKFLCKATLGLVCKLSVDLVCGTSSLDSRSIGCEALCDASTALGGEVECLSPQDSGGISCGGIAL